jgi:2-polyprenyl-3-methyl-5-hydroxy-6-metoxy-1,4-benzoquinol methylase
VLRLARLREVARRLPAPLQSAIKRCYVWLQRRRYGHVYRAVRESPTDYLMEFEHASYRKAKASILWDNWRRATPRTVRILETLGVVRDGYTVVDYGCGLGRVTRALAQRHRVGILGVDRSAEMLRHARRYIPQRYLQPGGVELLSDAELLERRPALQGTVDSVFAIEVVQHIPEPILDGLLPELLGLLKPQGRLFVLGHELLDVDASGASGRTPIASVLRRHARIERADVWTDGFAEPRFSFLCAPPWRAPDATAPSRDGTPGP